MTGKWKRAGKRLFHNNMTIPEKTIMPTMTIQIIPMTLRIQKRFMTKMYLMIYNFVIQGLQSFTKMQDRISFSGNEGIDFLACELRDLFKGNITQFIPDEDGSLFFRQLLQGLLQRLPEQVPEISHFRVAALVQQDG